ncbi:response regulator [Streptomyces sp. TRM66268-LWL]|uniref:Response regulator n=1 Tax=Streptomyces polyasparticus TaxID=2767826 RepID=A0ABR7SDS2_9ACTN|nr:response regulator [Streptomyces polyasparticus]MBC9713568.1 response regulator [Streptomyces polyasparticus]
MAGGEEKVLLVDDHEDNLFALESALAPLGQPLERATSGNDALKTVLRGGIALVLLDVVMPQVSGLDVVRYMQRVEQTQNIPVILLTGFGRDSELARVAYRLGVADLVMKPVDPWSLRTKVRYLLAQRRRMQALDIQVRLQDVELRSLRSQLEALRAPHAAGPLPHPDVRVPPQPGPHEPFDEDRKPRSEFAEEGEA